MENFFKCPTCGHPLNRLDNAELKDALRWKIKQLDEELVK
jgi:transcription initiation factor IIE alpha subunit